MAYDETLAARVRGVLGTVDWTEQRMFGGLAFMVYGHMACGVVGTELMVRLGTAAVDDALREPHVRAMDFTGRPISTMAFVAAAGVATDDALVSWVGRALAYATTLPPR